jgi:hypothetical protein
VKNKQLEWLRRLICQISLLSLLSFFNIFLMWGQTWTDSHDDNQTAVLKGYCTVSIFSNPDFQNTSRAHDWGTCDACLWPTRISSLRLRVGCQCQCVTHHHTFGNERHSYFESCQWFSLPEQVGNGNSASPPHSRTPAHRPDHSLQYPWLQEL